MVKNVLVTSAGRRVSLVQAFQEALHEDGGRVLAGDASNLAPALFHADDLVRLPLLSAGDYVSRLLDIVTTYDVGLVVPTIDTELALLAEHRDVLAEHGCTALVSSPEVVAVSADKASTQEFMERHGITVPRGWTAETLDRDALPQDLFVKPRDGSSSLHCYSATRDTLDDVLPLVPNPIVQERLTGAEVTIDALLDLDGTPVHLVPRRRLRTVGGESIQGVTIDDDELGPWLRTVLDRLSAIGAVGPLTLQVFLTDDGPVLIEVNPRFGGGFPLTNAAGGRYPRWILEMLAGKSVAPRFGDYQRGLYMTRYYAETYTTTPPW